MEIRGKTISYSSYIKKKTNEKEKQLMTDIEHLEKEYDKNMKTITDKKKELEKIRDHKLMGNIIRSRAKWMDEGEKPTKYFLNLENRHYTNKTIPKLIKEESIEITDQKNILLEIEKFYSTLYKANEETFDLNLNELTQSCLMYSLINFLIHKLRKNLEGEISKYLLHNL